MKELYLTSTGGFNSPIKFGSTRRNVKKRISKINPDRANIKSISLRFLVYKNSVKVNNQKISAKGTKIFPIVKYASGVIPTPLDKATRKDKLELHHGQLRSIQVIPTKK